MGNLEPFWNHFGTVFRHLEQFFGHLEDIFEVSVFRKPHGLKNGRPARSQSDFLKVPSRFFCSVLSSLFDHFLTKFWTTFGCLFGCLLGAFSGLLRVSWEVSGPKNTKNPKVFQGFLKAVVCLFEAPDGSLGLILPPLWPIWFQSGPQNGSQKWSKK